MKKVLLAIGCVATLLTAQAQIPTNGLIDHWKLDNTLTNESTGRPLLQPYGRGICASQSSGLPTVTVRDPNPGDNFFTDKNGAADGAYHCYQKPTNDSSFCNQVPPNGIHIKLFAYDTRLETTLDYSFQNLDRTFALWAKRTNLNVASRLFFVGEQVSKRAFGLDLNAGSLATLFVWGAADDLNVTTTADTLWHHYAATYDGSKMVLYIDGLEVGQKAISNLNTGLGKMFFGANQNYLDDIRFYDRALSASEVATFVAQSPNSIKSNSFESMSIYPNPTNNILNIQTNATIEVITIYNLQGQNIMNITSNNNQLDLTSLAEGAYIMQINTKEGIARRTIIKQ